MKTSLRPKIRPTKRPKLRPSEEEIADIEAGRTIRRANRLKKLIEKEAEGLLDKTPLVPIKEPTGEPVREFELGGDVRHNPNRGKTY
tara:strand:+ start:552 stop:812 length:261 start_codon:yes stop_codon:yes gene_type:complete